MRVKRPETPGEVPLRGRVVPPILFWRLDMEVEIIDTPYSDRSCKNCAHCVKTEMRYCLHNHAFVAKNKWCSDWKSEDRKFEK